MSTLLLLLGLFSSSPAHDGAPPEVGWAIRDYLHYSSGDGFASYASTGVTSAFQVAMRPVPDGWGEEAAAAEPPTLSELANGAGFGFVLLLMILVPLGSSVVFLRPRGVTWYSGSQRITRAEARAMLGRF